MFLTNSRPSTVNFSQVDVVKIIQNLIQTKIKVMIISTSACSIYGAQLLAGY